MQEITDAFIAGLLRRAIMDGVSVHAVQLMIPNITGTSLVLVENAQAPVHRPDKLQLPAGKTKKQGLGGFSESIIEAALRVADHKLGVDITPTWYIGNFDAEGMRNFVLLTEPIDTSVIKLDTSKYAKYVEFPMNNLLNIPKLHKDTHLFFNDLARMIEQEYEINRRT